MSSNYLKLPELSKAIAYFIFKKGETDYKSIRQKFERFNEETINKSLNEVMSQSPPLLLFNNKNKTYKASPHLEVTLRKLRNLI